MHKILKFQTFSSFLFSNSLRFNYMTSVYESPDLRKICQMINEPFHKYNEDIEHLEQIKLLDQNGKLIGNYTMKEAKKKATRLKCDIVLFNEATSPPICKAFNYKDYLYKQFSKQLGHMSVQRKTKAVHSVKSIVVGTRITEFDMKNKVRMAVESSRKNAIIRVIVKLGPGIDEDTATNTLYAFRDLSADNLVPVGDVTLETSTLKEGEESGPPSKDYGKKEKELQHLQLEFKNVRAKKDEEENVPKMSEKEIKKLLLTYFKKEGDMKPHSIFPSEEADDIAPGKIKQKNNELDPEMSESSGEGEEETKPVIKKEKEKGKKFTEVDIRKMQLFMQISSLKNRKDYLTGEEKDSLEKLEKEYKELEEKKSRDFDEETAMKMLKDANQSLEILETQARMTKRLLHLAKLHQK